MSHSQTLWNFFPDISWGLYTDWYQLTMAQGYFLQNRHHLPATFEYFFRTPPFGGGFALFSGLNELVEFIQRFRFSPDDIAFLQKTGYFHDSFLEFLRQWQPQVEIHAVPEGTPVLAGTPVVQLTGPLLDLQLLESPLLNLLNFSTLISTKAVRMRLACQGHSLVLADFGMRRAHHLSALLGARAAIIGTFDGTSCTLAGKIWNLPVLGTMAHSWVQSFSSEEEAFLTFGRLYRDRAIFLIDTYNTLESGLPAAIRATRKLLEEGIQPAGIRLDSGNFLELIPRIREELRRVQLDFLRIFVSSAVDEYLIEELCRRNLIPHGLGVGTRLAVAHPDAFLDGVYKLVELEGTGRLKRTDDVEKILLPRAKQVYRIFDENHQWVADVVAPARKGKPVAIISARHLSALYLLPPHRWQEELEKLAVSPDQEFQNCQWKPLLHPVSRDSASSPLEIRSRTYQQISTLPASLRQLQVERGSWRSLLYYDVRLLQEMADLLRKQLVDSLDCSEKPADKNPDTHA